MSKFLKILALSAAVLVGTVSSAGATPVMYFVNADGSTYVLDQTHVGPLYTFTFTASFAGVTVSDALGDYALLISFKSKSTPVWTPGSLTAAPGTDSNWQVVQDDSNSNGCKAGISVSEWCDELKHDSTMLTGPVIATGTVLQWRQTMLLTSGVLDFTQNWPFKFTTTTGVWEPGKDPGTGDWQFGGYQISEELISCLETPSDLCKEDRSIDDPPPPSVPEPASLMLLGLGLVGLATVGRRSMRKQ